MSTIGITNPQFALLKAQMQTSPKAQNTPTPAVGAALSAMAASLGSANSTQKALMPSLYTPIAANEWAFVWGDPHFREADGGRFDVQKEGKFNILKDKGISFTADFQKVAARPGQTIDPKNDKRPTVTKSADLVIDGKKIHIDAKGKTTVNGKELKNFDPVTLGPDSSIAKTIDGSILIQTGEYTILFDSVGNGNRLDFAVKSGSDGVSADGVNPSGLLGETFDSDNIRLTKPKNSIDSYLVNKPKPGPDKPPSVESELQKLLQQIITMIQQLLLGFKA
jgi:hypothetical protein